MSNKLRTKVYVGFAGFSKNDPFVGVVISANRYRKREDAEVFFDKLVEEAAENLYYKKGNRSYKSFQDFVEDIIWLGHLNGDLPLMVLEEVLQGVPMNEVAEILHDLNTRGYAYLPIKRFKWWFS